MNFYSFIATLFFFFILSWLLHEGFFFSFCRARRRKKRDKASILLDGNMLLYPRHLIESSFENISNTFGATQLAHFAAKILIMKFLRRRRFCSIRFRSQRKREKNFPSFFFPPRVAIVGGKFNYITYGSWNESLYGASEGCFFFSFTRSTTHKRVWFRTLITFSGDKKFDIGEKLNTGLM